VRTLNIKKVDDKPMVILTKEKAKIHSHEPKGTRIKGSNIYTVERGPKIAGAKAAETTGKKSYRKSTVHQAIIIFQIITHHFSHCCFLRAVFSSCHKNNLQTE
jgi:hypothetical protein